MAKTTAQRALELMQKITGVPYTQVPEMVKSVAQPFMRAGAIGSELSVPLYEKQTGTKITKEQREALNKIQSLLLGKEGQQQFSQEYASNPMMVGAKSLAGITATVAPGGAKMLTGLNPKLANVIGAGGVGALSGFSRAKEGMEGQATATGGALGLVAGTLFEGIKGLNEKIQLKKADVPRNVNLTSQVKNDPFFLKSEKEIQSLADDVGVNVQKMSPRDKLNLVQQDFTVSQQKINQTLQNQKFDQNVLADKFTDNISLTDYSPGNKTYENKVNLQLQKLSELGDDAIALNQYKSSLRSQLANAFKKIDKGTALTKDEEVRMATWNAIKDTLDTISPEIRILNNRQAGLYKLADVFGEQVQKDKPATLGIPLTQGTGIDLPVSKEQLSRRTGQLWDILKAPGKLAGKVAEPAIAGVSELPQQLMQILTGAGVRSIESGKSPQAIQQTIPETTNVTTDQTQITPELRATLPPEKQRALDIIDQMEAQSAGLTAGQQGVLTPEMLNIAQLTLTPTEFAKLEAIYERQQKTTEPPKMTEKQRAYQGSADLADDAIKLLETGNVKGGIGRGVIGKVGEKLGTLSEDEQNYRSTVSLLRTAVKNALLGAAMSQQEMESIEGAIPEFNDDVKTAKRKLEQLKKNLPKLVNAGQQDTQEQQLLNLLQQQGVNL